MFQQTLRGVIVSHVEFCFFQSRLRSCIWKSFFMTDLSFERNKVLWYVDVAKCPPARCGEPNCMFSIAVIINIFAIFANDLLCHTVPLLWFAKKVAKYIKRVPLLLLFDLSQKLLTTKKTMTTSSTVADSWKTPLAIHFSQFVPNCFVCTKVFIEFC